MRNAIQPTKKLSLVLVSLYSSREVYNLLTDFPVPQSAVQVTA